MSSERLKNPIVRATIDALERGDRATWDSQFEPDATLYDDGSPRSLREFIEQALGHERFTSIESVSDDGLEVVGAFHSDQWGNFRTFFRFKLSPAGKIRRLDIGQAQ
ncbi:MAG: nuclear transport factor 2 family protein [Myxococcales bacterium]